ncbi:hypothetical protein ACM7G9_08900 [Pseudomonas aeruginosa]
MPIQGENGRNYALTRGEVWFDKFAPGTTVGTGERYFGNTPEITSSTDSENLDHFDSDHGVNEKDDSVTLSQNDTGQMTTDNIVVENLALYFRGITENLTQTAQTALTQTFKVKRGRRYQLGVSEATPQGLRHLDNVTLKKGTTDVAAAGNYEVDLDMGAIYIEVDATGLADDDEVTATYDVKAYTQTVVLSGTDEIEGALRYIGFNPKGEQMDYYWPRVKLSPNGDFALKSGDDWQTIPYNIEFLKKGNLRKLYITNRGTPA